MFDFWKKLFRQKRPIHKVARTWDNLPSCTMMMVQDFDLDQIIAAARSSNHDIICLISPRLSISPASGSDQIELLYQFADDPELAILRHRGFFYVRRHFLIEAGSDLVSSSLSHLTADLRKAAKRKGLNVA